MKKAFLAILVVIVLTAGYLPRPAMAQQPPPHEDPSAVGSQFNAVSMLGYLGLIMEVLGSRDYAQAADLLEQLRHANLPEDLRFIVDRFAELLGDLRGELESAETALVKASDLLDLGDRPAAKTELETGGRSLSEARRLLEDLQLATDELGRRFGVFGAKAGNQLKEAYDQLETLLILLDELWDRYSETLAELEAYLAAPETSDIPIPTLEPPVARPAPIPRVELIAPGQIPAEPVAVPTAESIPVPNAGAITVPDAAAITVPNVEAIAVPDGESKAVPTAEASVVLDPPDTATTGRRFANVAILAIVLAAAAYMAGALIVARVRRLNRRKHIEADGLTVSPSRAPDLSVTDSVKPLPDWALIDSATSRGRVVSAYHLAAQYLAASMAVVYEPYFTLRDFLLAIGSRVTDSFDQLTSEAERALYASDAHGEESALRAESLADAVQEEAR